MKGIVHVRGHVRRLKAARYNRHKMPRKYKPMRR